MATGTRDGDIITLKTHRAITPKDMEELQRRLRELEAERRALEVALAAVMLNPGGAPSSDDVVALSVGGQRFVTTRETLTRVPDTFFSALLSGRFEASMDSGDNFNVKNLQETNIDDSQAVWYKKVARRAPVKLRDPAPVLPWLVSNDIETVLDASNAPQLVAFSYKWVEQRKLSDPDPPGVPTCAHVEVIIHTVDVPYATSLPLLCSFAAPPQPRFLSGSFNASPMDDTDEIRAFYRGMAPSPLMLRRTPRSSIELMVE
jgi:BTB/POZ domain